MWRQEPSGEKATELTSWCPSNVAIQPPVCVSQNLMIPSWDADASWQLLGEKATKLI